MRLRPLAAGSGTRRRAPGARAVLALVLAGILIAPRVVPAATPASAPVVTPPAAGPYSCFITRDDFGVPHIRANDRATLFRAMGYAVAEDRLWQLELLSRTGLGELAEVMGPAYRPGDALRRRLRFTPAEAESLLLQLEPGTREIIGEYCNGVNDRIAEVMAHRDSLLPREFIDAGCDPTPWSPVRMQAVMMYLARAFGQAGGGEPERLAELIAIGPEAFDARYPVNDPSAPTTIGPSDAAARPAGYPAPRTRAERLGLLRAARDRWSGAVSPEGGRALEEMRASRRLETAHLALPPTFGSYGVAIAAGKSASGSALLFGGPQIGSPAIDTTQLGLEVELDGAGFRVSGMTIAGIPAVIVGRNESIAWTLTSGITDNTDTYIETLNPANADEYLFQGRWRRFESRTETIATRGAASQVITARRSVHGPVFGWDPAAGQAFSWRIATRGTELEWIEFLLALDRAASLEEAGEASRRCTLSFNLIAASRDGGIGYWHAGRYPDRPGGVDPRLPLDGRGAEEWRGLLPLHVLPSCVRPLSGAVISWNNKPVSWWNNGDNMPWVGGQHVTQLEEYLLPDPAVSFEELRALPRLAAGTRGTYQQVIEFSDPVRAENILPPGQSGFIAPDGTRSPHFADQWVAYRAWDYKPWLMRTVAGDAADDPACDPETRAAIAAADLAILVHPRPSPGAVEIQVRGSAGAPREAAIYDVTGRLVRALHLAAGAPGAIAAAGGPVTLAWDARDAHGRRVPAGVYFVRVRAGAATRTGRVVINP